MRLPARLAIIVSAAILAWGVTGCGRKTTGAPAQLTYDKKTGKLQQIASDNDHDGKIDTWAYMDGARPIRAEQDLDGDGQIDRWEYYDEHGTVVKVGLSQRKTGTIDTWMYPDAQGRPMRIEYPSRRHADTVRRREFYENGKLVRVEEDTKDAGAIDKWEAHDGLVIRSVEFDLNGDGRPDERLTFDEAGRVVMTETEPDGHGGYQKKVLTKRSSNP